MLETLKILHAPTRIDKRRVRARKAGEPLSTGPVLYWMGRDQRVSDNWALLAAAQLANDLGVDCEVVFVLPPGFERASYRHYDFLIRGLSDVATALGKKGIHFTTLEGDPVSEIVACLQSKNVSALVTDFNPIRQLESWKNAVAERVDIPVYEVDAHNCVPAWHISHKQEVGARTLRPKIYREIASFFTEFPDVPQGQPRENHFDAERFLQNVVANREVAAIDWALPGETAAQAALQRFLTERLRGYDERRNDPASAGQSDLSPYLHFGHISPQRVAMEVVKAIAPSADKAAFLEELVVRRELSDNFCLYNENYDSLAGAPGWALRSLESHAADPRDYVYTIDQFAKSETHDALWNAAQWQLVSQGKMHGYMRMYWAKKILEWTPNAAEAHRIALSLNDTYSIDGNDPNGFVGVLWSIAGLHDRPWFDRAVYGVIRYMARSGCEKKGDIHTYLSRFTKS